MGYKSVDKERVIILAEEIVNLKRELKELNKALKNEFEGITIPFSATLSNKGKLEYEFEHAKPKFDYKSYTAFLQMKVKDGEQLSDDQLEEIQEQFTSLGKDKWKIKVKQR